MRINVSNDDDPLANFSFGWYEGNIPNNINEKPSKTEQNGPEWNKRHQSNYVAYAIHKETECLAYASFQLNANPIYPKAPNLDLLKNNDSCATPNGQVNAHVEGQQMPYEFVWYNEKNLTNALSIPCLLYTSPSPRDRQKSRMPSSA